MELKPENSKNEKTANFPKEIYSNLTKKKFAFFLHFFFHVFLRVFPRVFSRVFYMFLVFFPRVS